MNAMFNFYSKSNGLIEIKSTALTSGTYEFELPYDCYRHEFITLVIVMDLMHV